MLFNSFEFILLFLPATLIVYYLSVRFARKRWFVVLLLIIASLSFYSYWNIRYVGLLLISIIFNYGIGYFIVRAKGIGNNRLSKLCFAFGVCVDILALSYFKYLNFFLENLNYLVDTKLIAAKIILPIGISFFTFTQIAFLVDTYRDRSWNVCNLLDYMLFVTYFPHLIAGPIYHHKEIIPQFQSIHNNGGSIRNNIVIGLSVFSIGLLKKVVFADQIAEFVKPAFSAVISGSELGFIEAWGGALAYTLQIYYDFSGYIDMAIGLSMMMGIRLPVNFFSPYKSLSIIDFWRRWHMTLSRFLRDYLYIPLGGNRKGETRRLANILITMLLGGLWHGAGWTFVLWGALHGVYLAINHVWRRLGRKYFASSFRTGWSTRLLASGLTFICVTVAWVFFRAESIRSALSMVKSMAGLNGFALLNGAQVWKGSWEAIWILGLLFIAWFLPNTTQIMHRYHVTLAIRGNQDKIIVPSFFQWEMNTTWGILVGAMVFVSLLALFLSEDVSEFLYFQF